jgi:hypothetical protein
MTCLFCGSEMVNIFYGMPTAKALELARNEKIALGGTVWSPEQPTHYCYGCHETFPPSDVPYNE